MKNPAIVLLLAAVMLAGCMGIPLRSMPRLMKLQGELLDANPAEFMVAIQVDARMVPAAGSAPVLKLAIQPSQPGAFEAIDKKLAMRITIASANSLGLATPPPSRRWLVYSLPPESQAELLRIQDYFKGLQSRGNEKRGGSVTIGIAQDGIAVKDPALANTRWESWLRTSQREGFYELWSGSLADLLKAGS
jgi:hypothetical protein